ncbi:MAG: immune inhibitor, partial [Actinomycetota bacterium]|nr:immune inhibitor [Actinomycetota bacterium]
YLAKERSEGGAGADVINVSLGSGRLYGAPLFGVEQVTDADPEAQLVNSLAVQHNVVFTISAGNSGPVLQSLGAPSVAAQAISVGASITDYDLNHPVEQTDHGEFGNIRPDATAAGATAIAGFSSRGPSGDRLVKPDLTAPGAYWVAAESSEGGEVKAADIAHNNHYSADPTYAVLSGTSMSAPAAAGASALVIDGYRRDVGSSPLYYRVKAALANTAGTRAYEGAVAGLTGTIRAKLLGSKPEDLYRLRNDAWVGVTGQGSGRLNASAALFALTRGVTAYTPASGAIDSPKELQPSWAIDDLAGGASSSRSFTFHGGPRQAGSASVTFAVDTGHEAKGVQSAPASWFTLPASVAVAPNGNTAAPFKVSVPSNARPGLYTATVVGSARIGTATQKVRIPVQFFVRLGTSIEAPIWASDVTDYSLVGFENPLGDVYTDWALYPVVLSNHVQRASFKVYDPAGTDHMDVFVLNDAGQEIDSTVTPFLEHAVPGGAAYTPTTKTSPNEAVILDGNDLTDVTLPTTVWVAVSDSGPAKPSTFSTFHLDVELTKGAAGAGTTPPERIHSGSHAWWSGSASGANSALTRAVDLSSTPASASPQLSFWTWYRLENGYDWAYALVSINGGATWTSLATTSPDSTGTTTLDPIGTAGGLGGSKAYANGLTGDSGSPPTFTGQNLTPALSQQTADLTPYAGKQVLLRFAYTSDSGTNNENFYVDDIAVKAGASTVFTDDAETRGAWTSSGTPGFAWMTKETPAG